MSILVPAESGASVVFWSLRFGGLLFGSAAMEHGSDSAHIQPATIGKVGDACTNFLKFAGVHHVVGPVGQVLHDFFLRALDALVCHGMGGEGLGQEVLLLLVVG